MNDLFSRRPIGSAGTEILTLAAAKRSLSIEDDFTGDDVLIQEYLDSAHDYIGRSFNLQLRKQDLELGFRCFPREDRIQIPIWPIQAVLYFRYIDSSGNSHDLTEGTGYKTALDAMPAEVVLPYTGTWPSAVLDTTYPVKVGVTAGYLKGDSPESYPVPGGLMQAMRLLVGRMYEYNSPEVDDATEETLRRLMSNVRLH